MPGAYLTVGAGGSRTIARAVRLLLLNHPPHATMRAFILTLALSLPLALSACADSAEQNAIDEGAPAGDRADVIGDGEIFDEPGEPDADVLGDGLVTYDTDGDGMISVDEYGTGVGDDNFGTYDADGDGFLNNDEYMVYERSLDM